MLLWAPIESSRRGQIDCRPLITRSEASRSRGREKKGVTVNLRNEALMWLIYTYGRSTTYGASGFAISRTFMGALTGANGERPKGGQVIDAEP